MVLFQNVLICNKLLGIFYYMRTADGSPMNICNTRGPQRNLKIPLLKNPYRNAVEIDNTLNHL